MEEKPKSENAQPFDFRHPVFLSSGQWRKLRLEISEFTESLAALLSTYLRVDFGLQIGKLQTVAFGEFTASLPVPTHLTMFKADPLRGISVMEIRPALGMAIVDRLLGGPGKSSTLARNLSEMEVALLDQYVEIVLSEWCKHWRKFQEMRPAILGHENNGKFLQTSTGSTILLVLTLEARMGEVVDQMQLAFPYVTLEPLIDQITQEIETTAPSPAPASTPLKWNKNLADVPVTLTAQWPSIQVNTGKLLNLKPGDILEISPELAETVEIRVGSVRKFRGRLGARGEKKAVQITEILKP